LLDAALGVLAREGAGALTLREVARRAGVSHAAPYRHFPDKEALLAGVSEQGFRTFTQMMREAADAAGRDALRRFEAIGKSYLRFALLHKEHFLLMFGRAWGAPGKHAGLDEAGEEALQVLVGAIQDCQAAGLMRAGDANHWALAAWSAVHGAAVLLLEHRLQPLLLGPDCTHSALDEKSVDQVATLLAQVVREGLSK
jgi:AcrR family transcriptional regulator